MITVRDYYNESIIQNFPSMIYLIEWLVYEKKVLTMDRDARNIEYIMNHPTKDIWPEVKSYIAKRKGAMIDGVKKTGDLAGAS